LWIFRAHGCPCGYFTDQSRDRRCSPHEIQRYISKIRWPLPDEIDTHVEVPRVKPREPKHTQGGATVAGRSVGSVPGSVPGTL